MADTDLLIYFMSIDKCKFRRKVVPGDVLEMHLTTLRGKPGGKIWKFRRRRQGRGRGGRRGRVFGLCDGHPREMRRGDDPDPSVTAIIEARRPDRRGCVVGPFCVWAPRSRLAIGVELKSHVVVTGNTEIGAETVIFPSPVIGEIPQDLKFGGEETPAGHRRAQPHPRACHDETWAPMAAVASRGGRRRAVHGGRAMWPMTCRSATG
jgi:hypothetical protein